MFQLPFLIEASLVIALGCIVYKLLFEKENNFYMNRAYLLVLVLWSFILPFISIPIISEKLYITSNVGSVVSPLTPAGLDWNLLLLVVYSAVALTFLIRLVYAYFQIYRFTKSINPISKEGTAYHISDKVKSPASFFNHVFLRIQDEQKEVIEHELVHVKHLHSADVLLVQIAKSMQWFNPFIYYLERALKENHEYTADHIASRKLSGPIEFSEYLLSFATVKPKLSLPNTFNSFIKKRIMMLNKMNNSTQNSLRPFLILPIIIGLFALFAFDKYPTYYSAETGELLDSIPQSHLDTIFTFGKDGKEVAQVVRVFPNEMVENIDTITTFDFDTYEETIQIVKTQQPKTIIIYPSIEGVFYTEIIDTVITMDFDTYEETVRYVKRKIPKVIKKK